MPHHLRISVAFVGSFLIFGLVCSDEGQAGSLEPAAPPGPTMQTLEQAQGAWDKLLLANDGPDSCNSSRFTCVMGGVAVRDNETGLVWEQAPLTTTHDWATARSTCPNRTVGGRKGWRLPSFYELASIVDPNNPTGDPDLPPGHPFDLTTPGSAVLDTSYWSSTTFIHPTHTDDGNAWFVNFLNGNVDIGSKVNATPIWCVRGGSPGPDAY
jgi:hypothetical protein